MATYELLMPKMGESIIEATILKWNKEIGEEVEQEEPVLEIATDKVDSEVPAPVDGKLLETRFQEGEVVPVGAVIAIIETVAEEGASQDTPQNGQHVQEDLDQLSEQVPYVPSPSPEPALERATQASAEGRFYSPLVLNIARKEGISMTELEELSGSGRGGRVTKKDILNFVEQRERPSSPDHLGEVPSQEPLSRRRAPGAQPQTAPSQEPQQPPKQLPASTSDSQHVHISPKSFQHSGHYEIEEMDRMRKMIAENMVYSKHVSAHVTSFVEADVTSLVHWRNQQKARFQRQYGEKLTFTPLFLQAVVKALREFPRVNASIEGDKLLLKKDIHVGIAVALPNDNLIVPVVKHADRLNLAGLASTVNDLAMRARENRLKPEELEGGTYTLSNVGTFGNVMGTPIILQPQLAILAVGAIRKVPAVMETPQGDMIAIRQKMFLSHSYDHRAIDGALGGKFVRRVADHLENWNLHTEI